MFPGCSNVSPVLPHRERLLFGLEKSHSVPVLYLYRSIKDRRSQFLFLLWKVIRTYCLRNEELRRFRFRKIRDSDRCPKWPLAEGYKCS
jgi:hypothetical protein